MSRRTTQRNRMNAFAKSRKTRSFGERWLCSEHYRNSQSNELNHSFHLLRRGYCLISDLKSVTRITDHEHLRGFIS